MIKHYSNNIQDIIQRELFAAQDSIKIAVAWFTNDLLFYPLLHKLITGVKVELILNKDDVNFSKSNIVDFDQFLQQGGVLYLNETKRLLHDKFCIIDNRIVISGSYNWTNGAKHNYETITVFTDELESVRYHKELFESLKVGFTRQQGSTNTPAPSADTPRIEKKETSSRITYTSLDECIVVPNEKADFGANVVSNTYEDGKGVIVFDREITTIPRLAFFHCSNLISIILPSGITIIENGVFSFSGIDKITLPETLTTINGGAFLGCANLRSLIISTGVHTIGRGAFRRCSNLTSVDIPDTVTEIGEGAFGECESLVNITIPNSVKKIGGGTFFRCSNLTRVVIPDSVTEIGERAFQYCESLAHITIPSSVTTIGEWAFGECESLVNVTIPNSVTKIGAFAFQFCNKLRHVYCMALLPPSTCTPISPEQGTMWCGIPSYANICVPRQSVEAYKEAEGWSFYSSTIIGCDCFPH